MPEETQNDIQPDAQDERRPVDYSREAAGYTEEATELLAQIKQAEPKYTRDEQLQTVIDLLDKSHERSVKAYIDLQNDE